MSEKVDINELMYKDKQQLKDSLDIFGTKGLIRDNRPKQQLTAKNKEQ